MPHARENSFFLSVHGFQVFCTVAAARDAQFLFDRALVGVCARFNTTFYVVSFSEWFNSAYLSANLWRFIFIDPSLGLTSINLSKLNVVNIATCCKYLYETIVSCSAPLVLTLFIFNTS